MSQLIMILNPKSHIFSMSNNVLAYITMINLVKDRTREQGRIEFFDQPQNKFKSRVARKKFLLGGRRYLLGGRLLGGTALVLGG